MPTILYQEEVDGTEHRITFDFGRPINELIKGHNRERVEIVIVALDTDPEEALAQTMEAVERTRALDIGQDKLAPAQQERLGVDRDRSDEGSYVRYIESLVETHKWDGEEERCVKDSGRTARSTTHQDMLATNSMLVQLHRVHAVSLDRHAEEIVALKAEMSQARAEINGLRELTGASVAAQHPLRTVRPTPIPNARTHGPGAPVIHDLADVLTAAPPATPRPTNDLEAVRYDGSPAIRRRPEEDAVDEAPSEGGVERDHPPVGMQAVVPADGPTVYDTDMDPVQAAPWPSGPMDDDPVPRDSLGPGAGWMPRPNTDGRPRNG